MSGLHGPHDQGPSHLSMPLNSLQPPHIIPGCSGLWVFAHSNLNGGEFCFVIFFPRNLHICSQGLGDISQKSSLKRPFLPTYQNLQILKQFT